MDYIGKKCPVCDKYFHVGDDIVVCPDCGTPSHRECYVANGRCINFDKHKDEYDYTSDTDQNTENEEGIVICKKCGTQNEDELFFCKKCGTPLNENQQTNNNPYSSQQTYGQPFMGMNPEMLIIDPLGGVKPETDFGDNITAGECAKFVKQSTQYFITVFNSIKNFSKSRFNFCAFLFGGGYLLYRKMYKLGTLFTVFQALVIAAGFYFTNAAVYADVFNAYMYGDFASVPHHLSQLGSFDMTLLAAYSISSILVFVMKIVLGICTNKMYFRHCKKQINKIKSDVSASTQMDTVFAKKGGVNVPLATSLLISYMILSYIPHFFL